MKELFPMPKQLVEKFDPEKFLYMINNGLAAYSGFSFLTEKSDQGTVIVSTAAGATGLLLIHLFLSHTKVKVIALTSPKKIEPLRKIFPKIYKIVNYQDKEEL